MKNFIIYSKKNIKKDLNTNEICDIKYITRSIKFSYLINIFNIFYAISKKLYTVAILLFSLQIIFFVFVYNFPEYEHVIFFIKLSVYIFFVLFAFEIEEYFLIKKGYTMQTVVQAKNEKEARAIIENELKISFKDLPKKRFFIF